MAAPIDEFDRHSAIGCPPTPLRDVVIPALFRRLSALNPRICLIYRHADEIAGLALDASRVPSLMLPSI